jgi:outer membrane protein OmpA-like peptidoglycan-associated protein
MNRARRRWGSVAAAQVALATCAARGRADETPSLALEPAPAGDPALLVEEAGVEGHLSLAARTLIDFAYQPLSLRNAAQELDPVLDYQLWQHTLVSLAIFRRASFQLDVPFAFQGEGTPPASGATAPRVDAAAGFGDIRLGARVKLYGSADDNLDPKPWDERIELGLSAALWLPTGTDGYTGDGSVRGGGQAIVSAAGPSFQGAFNLGIRSRPAEELPGALPTRVATSLHAGLAWQFYADGARDLALGTEVVGDTAVLGGARFLDPRATAGFFFVTASYRVAGAPFVIGAALGPGLGGGAGSADFRALLSLGYAPESVPPPPDEDEDGVPDKDDACVRLAGEPSSDRLLSGCPPPPPDKDGDAIPDENDGCPDVPGIATGELRTHGCPRDGDGDGVPDAGDACPEVKGVRPPEGDGCPAPEPEPPTVVDKIEIGERILFANDTATLLPESTSALEQVARVLHEHPEIARVEVQGHTDGTGAAERNDRLGEERALAVVAWLTAHGVAAERLSARGYGASRPIADNDSEEGRAQNRRVEFHVLERREVSP